MKQILIMDDEPAVRYLLQKMLESEGYRVMTASDGEQGMALLLQNPVDLVITDLIMPEKEGIEIIMEMAKEYPEIPVIAISGGGFNAPESYLNIALAAGAKAALKKPLKKETLLCEVNKLLGM